jgi:hypothetical protein
MSWLAETTARWLRIMAAAGPGTEPPEAGVRLISEIGDASAGAPARRSRRGRRGRPAPTPQGATVIALGQHLIVSLLAGDELVTRLGAATGQTREDVLAELSGGLSQWLSQEQLRVLSIELAADSATSYAAGWPSYAALGSRIEQLLRLAEGQATEILAEAKAAASCPHCGAARHGLG